MKCQSRKVGSIPVLTLSGRFDAYEAPKVKGWLEDLLDDGPEIGPETGSKIGPEIGPERRSQHALINLSGVNFIDSTGLSTLVQAMKRLRQAQGELYLSNFQQPVLVIFELTRLDKAFHVYPTEEMALEALQAIIYNNRSAPSPRVVSTPHAGQPWIGPVRGVPT